MCKLVETLHYEPIPLQLLIPIKDCHVKKKSLNGVKVMSTHMDHKVKV
jgi:hypothetical protein